VRDRVDDLHRPDGPSRPAGAARENLPMAKMFYTLEEACQKLGKSEDEVRELASSGQLQEFRDRDRLMFKVEQVDLLAGGGEDEGDEFNLELEDTSAGSALELSGTGIPMTDTGGTGVSIFETEHGDEDAQDEPAALSGTGHDLSADSYGDDLQLEAVGSGSGLLDLTRESDDTSLGAELLEEVYSGEDQIEIPANASGLFDAAPGEIAEDVGAPAGVAAIPVVVEAYDGSGSGLGVGMMIGAIAALVCVALVVVVAVTGGTPQLAMLFAGNLMMYAGILLGATVVFGALGFVIGRASE